MPSIEFMDCTGDEIKSTELDLEKSTPEEVKKALIEHLSPEVTPSYPESWQAAADDYELSEDVI